MNLFEDENVGIGINRLSDIGGDSCFLKNKVKESDGTHMFGTFKGVRVGVIKTNGQIGTVFPDKIQPQP